MKRGTALVFSDFALPDYGIPPKVHATSAKIEIFERKREKMREKE